MAVQTAERPDLVDTDRTFYADLWGTTSGAARAREGWRNVRARSGVLAAIAVLALVGYLGAGPLFAGAPSSDHNEPPPAEHPATATAPSD